MRFVLATLCWLLGGAVAPVQAQADPYFREAERQYSNLTVEQRLWFQIALTSTGYWPAVPNVNYSRRLHEAIRQFQHDRGEPATGIVTTPQVSYMLDTGKNVLGGWGFRWIPHPMRGRSIWVPMGLGLLADRTEYGAAIRERSNRFKLKFEHYDSLNVRTAYEVTLKEMVTSGDNILYKIVKPDFFVIAGHQGKYNRYVRFHADAGGILGFDMTWSTEEAPIFGNRLVTVISASLWASMTGAPFPTVPRGRYPWEDDAPVARAPQPTVPAAVSPPTPAPKSGGGSGTGFFVSTQGHVVTNEHVVESCSTIIVKGDGLTPRTATLMASDKENDLALLKVDQVSPGSGSLRVGIRLGEPVAVFGFPLTDVLAASGNFTTGHVSALAGMGNDARHVQISAPVQKGNSGGPLLDESGNVVGVVTYKLNAVKAASATGDIPQNVNFAVKTTSLLNFLDLNRVTYKMGSLGETLKSADLAERGQAMSVLVQCK